MATKIADGFLTVITVVVAGCALWLAASGHIPRVIDAVPSSSVPMGEAQPLPVATHRVGDIVAEFQGVNYALSSMTLLIVVRSDCIFCSASKSFYVEIVKRERGARSGVRVFLAAPLSDAGYTSYMTDLSMSADRRVQFPEGSLSVSGTPSLLLVDRSGHLHSIWRGKIPMADEHTVLDAIFGSAVSN